MKILKINPENPEKEVVDKTVATLKKGGAVVYPTDTVYGLGVNAFDEDAVKKIFQIKGRDFNKPISIIVKDIEIAKKVASFGKEIEEKLKKLLPGPITVVLYKKKILPDILTAGVNKIGIRIPDCKITRLIMEKLDFPMTTTSANISGEGASGNISEILRQFKNKKPDLILDAGILPTNQPSTVIDLTGPEPKILRAGPVNKNELKEIFNNL